MRFPIGEMTIGDILDRGLKLLMRRFGTFYGLMFLILLPSLAVQVFLSFDTGGAEEPSAIELPAMAAAFIVLIGSSIILSPLGTAAILRVIAQEFLGKRVGFGEALKFGWSRYGTILLVSLMVGLVEFVGFLMLFVPGVIFSIWYAFAQQVVVVEHIKGGRALARSKELTTGYRMQIFRLSILLGLINLGSGMLIGLLQVVLPSNYRVQTDSGMHLKANTVNTIINLTANYAVTTGVTCLSMICLTLYYFNLRIKKEGLDLELALAHIEDERAQPIEPKPSVNLEEDFGPP